MIAATVAAAIARAGRTPRPNAEPKGLPVTPQRGKAEVKDVKSGVIAIRRADRSPAVRIFTSNGRLDKSWQPGTTFESHNAKNLYPGGTWEVLAVIDNGQVTQGTAPHKPVRYWHYLIG